MHSDFNIPVECLYTFVTHWLIECIVYIAYIECIVYYIECTLLCVCCSQNVSECIVFKWIDVVREFLETSSFNSAQQFCTSAATQCSSPRCTGSRNISIDDLCSFVIMNDSFASLSFM